MTDRTLQASGLCVSDWYRKGHRDLPWRKTRDPYRILVSEIMLQQTRVDTVVGYYARFLDAFPDAEALAAASEEAVMALWQGLGYYSRARNLQKAARTVMETYGGRFPDTVETLRSLPGVGPYTAGAIASIAFDIPAPAIDGNVLRVVARLRALDTDIAKPAALREMTTLVQEMIPANRAADFCQGMMELGATVCVPGTPGCTVCPVSSLCLARAAGRERELPVRSAKSAPVVSHEAVFLLRDSLGRILLTFREKGLLSGLWGLPMAGWEYPDEDRLAELLQADGFPDTMRWILGEAVGSCRHVFTHRVWEMRIHEGCCLTANIEKYTPEGYKWVLERDLGCIPIPEAFRKALRTAGLKA